MFLLDTNVVSEFRRARPHGAVSAWMRSVPPASIFIPAVVAGEIMAGILKLAETDPERANILHEWFEAIDGSANYLVADAAVFKRWAQMMRKVHERHFVDALIAATAWEHGLSVVTRNTRDFEIFGVATINPFEWKG